MVIRKKSPKVRSETLLVFRFFLMEFEYVIHIGYKIVEKNQVYISKNVWFMGKKCDFLVKILSPKNMSGFQMIVN